MTKSKQSKSSTELMKDLTARTGVLCAPPISPDCVAFLAAFVRTDLTHTDYALITNIIECGLANVSVVQRDRCKRYLNLIQDTVRLAVEEHVIDDIRSHTVQSSHDN